MAENKWVHPPKTNMDTQNDGLENGVLAPPMLLGKDAVGKDPCSCVDGLEKVTPFKN